MSLRISAATPDLGLLAYCAPHTVSGPSEVEESDRVRQAMNDNRGDLCDRHGTGETPLQPAHRTAETARHSARPDSSAGVLDSVISAVGEERSPGPS